MKIEDLRNQNVKISALSITCKDENGKTKGVVTGAEKFRNLPPRRAMDYFSKIKSAGLWGVGELDNVYIYDGKIYYLFDLRPVEFYNKYIAGHPGFENEEKRHKQRNDLAENVAKMGIEVIPCYVD